MPDPTDRGFRLDPFQTEAIAAIDRGEDVLVAAPTGAGKTLIAEHACRRVLDRGGRAVYTAPIKALSNQKFRDFRLLFGREQVGIVTGDISINSGAPLVIMTTEIFRNTIFEDPRRLEGIRYLLFDEIHFLDDDERGTVWEESILFAPPEIGLVGLSATIANLDEFAGWLRSVRQRELAVIRETKRPVPLEHRLFTPAAGVFPLGDLKQALRKGTRGEGGRGRGRKRGRRSPGPDLLRAVQRQGQLPCLFFCFNRRACETKARYAARRGYTRPEDGRRLAATLDALALKLGVGAHPATLNLRYLVERGVAFHHAGLLPAHKEIVERLFTTGELKLLFTTETFALGINMPAASVVFDDLEKFDGVGFGYLRTREYQQMAGRAGRRGMDEQGFVYSRLDLRHRLDPNEIKRILTGQVEPIVSRFNLSYSTLLNLYRLAGNRIEEALERSFYSWQRRRRPALKGEPPLRAQVRRRLKLLAERGYLEEDPGAGERLTPRGRLAAALFVCEIPLTELFYAGRLEGLDPHQLNALFMGLIFERRSSDVFRNLPGNLVERVVKPAAKVVAHWCRQERRAGLGGTTREPDFSFSAAAEAFSRGADFHRLDEYASVSAGDQVRAFRLSIQAMRQARKVLADHPDLPGRLEEAIALIRRGPVDAEAQMLQAESLDA